MADGYTAGVGVSGWKGHPILNLPMGQTGRYSFNFGLSKAKTILAHVEDIKLFVEEYDGEKEQP